MPTWRWLPWAVCAVCLVAGSLAGCPRVDPSRPVIDHLRFHGVRQAPGNDLRDKIATRGTERLLGVRLPWTAPEYYDETTFGRDLERIHRFYRARGYYSAAVQAVHIAPRARGREIDID